MPVSVSEREIESMLVCGLYRVSIVFSLSLSQVSIYDRCRWNDGEGKIDFVGSASLSVSEITTELAVMSGRAVACAVDGHGGQDASRHAADRLPGLVASYATKAPEAALKAAWVRCAEELELDGPGGAVAACRLAYPSRQA